MELFYIITMIGKGGKNLYLSCTDNDKIMAWTTNIDEACWFPTGYDAEKFAKQYFKNFKRYYITAYNYNIDKEVA